MATQAGVATSKVIILVFGAGLTGHYVFGKARLSDFIASLQEALSKDSNKKDGNAGQSTESAALEAQIRRLAQEVKQLYAGRQITVLTGNDNQSSNLASFVVPVAVMGAAGYCYMWWKGWSFSDLMYVTKRNMANAVASFTKQLEQMSAALAATKRHLSQRLEHLNQRMDEQKEVTGAIKNEVSEVRGDLAQMGLDIDCVQRLVQGLELKIDTIEGKQDLTNAGVVYLCRFVQGLAGAQKPEILQSTSGKPRLERSQSSLNGVSGLKGLQYFSEALQSRNDNKPSNENTFSNNGGITSGNVTPSPTLHRTLRCS